MVEYIRKLNRDWDYFLASTNIPLDPKGDTPLSTKILVSNRLGGKEKEIEGPSPSHPIVKKGRRLELTDEEK